MTKTMNRGAFALPGSSLDFKTGTWRNTRPVHSHGTAPCHGACPAGEDQQKWLSYIQVGDFKKAWESLVKANPMPAVTGRVCPHPCETACNRGYMDQPIAIHGIERWLGDQAIMHGWQYPSRDNLVQRSERIAVVGAGPAGLSAAYHLNRRGFKVSLFDAMPEAGGLLRSAIPPTRLPREVLDAEIARIAALGIDVQMRMSLGRDMSLEQLRADYDAVFLGIGTSKSRPWDVNGEVPQDLAQGLALLQRWLVAGAIPQPKSVVIHGGGNTAVDLARVMRRNGTENVCIVTASGLPGPDTDPDDVLNIVPRELELAMEEGVVFYPHRTLSRLIMRGSKVVGVEIVRLKKIPDAKGRKARVPFPGTEMVLNADMVVPAIGEVVDPKGVESVLGSGSHFAVDMFGQMAEHRGVFVGGDARRWSNDYPNGTVSAAIGDGRRAAEAIDAFLSKRDPVEYTRRPAPYDQLNTAYYEHAPRIELPTVPLAERDDVREVEGGPTDNDAVVEALRCLSCGNCMTCDNCWTLCPDNAVIKTAERQIDHSFYVFDYEYCKGCGICAKECPCGYIKMEADVA